MQFMLLSICLFCTAMWFTHGFVRPSPRFTSKLTVRAFTPEQTAKLEDTRERYEKLSSSIGSENEAEAAKLKDLAESYNSYLEAGKILRKIRTMYKNEPGEARKARQLKSFMELYAGRVELEQAIKEKMGLPVAKVAIPAEISEIKKWDATVAELQKKYQEASFKVPTGMSTIEARFGSRSNRSLSNTN